MRFRNKMLGMCLALGTLQIHAMTTDGNQIIDSTGKPVELKGINWFGFNNGDTMVDGLWAGPDNLSLDFATVVYRMQLLGCNAVRLPFSFKDVFGLAPRNYNLPTMAVSQSVIKASVTDPSVTAMGDIPPQKSPPTVTNPNVSNSYLPNDTTLNRFLWVVNFFAKNGFYVLIDNHLREDQTVLEQGKANWVQDWVRLVTAISNDPISKEMLLIDLLNEPDNFGIRWEASGNNPGLGDLYLSAMDALYAVNPHALFLLEGTGQGGIGANWGDGFATDPTLISQNGLSDPRPFFNSLLQKPYLNQVVISPHVYPPSVTGASTNYSGSGLWNRMSSSFGYLTQQGYCFNSKCKIFPVVLGEFGSMFTDSRDLQSMPDIAAYLNNTGSAVDGKHKKIGSWFYWAWNANSGDTGGIVDNDWRKILWNKVEYLETIGLTPWYLTSPPPVEFGKLCVSVASVNGLTPGALQPITAGNYTYTVTAFNTPVCQEVNVGNYSVNAPEIISGNHKFDAPSQTVSVAENLQSTVQIHYTGTVIPPDQSNTSVVVQIGTPWQEGGQYKNAVNLYFTNKGTKPVNVPWQFTMKNSSYTGVSTAWNLTVNSVSNGVITSTVSSNWEVLNANGTNTVNVGAIISSSSPNFMPTEITVNGTPATIVHQ